MQPLEVDQAHAAAQRSGETRVAAPSSRWSLTPALPLALTPALGLALARALGLALSLALNSPVFSTASCGDNTTLDGSIAGARASLSPVVTDGMPQYIMPMPDAYHRANRVQRITPIHRWQTISVRRARAMWRCTIAGSGHSRL